MQQPQVAAPSIIATADPATLAADGAAGGTAGRTDGSTGTAAAAVDAAAAAAGGGQQQLPSLVTTLALSHAMPTMGSVLSVIQQVLIVQQMREMVAAILRVDIADMADIVDGVADKIAKREFAPGAGSWGVADRTGLQSMCFARDSALGLNYCCHGWGSKRAIPHA